jgi:hypothetical protein
MRRRDFIALRRYLSVRMVRRPTIAMGGFVSAVRAIGTLPLPRSAIRPQHAWFATLCVLAADNPRVLH